MQSNNLKILVEKYWTGETSLTEEETLRTYFSDNVVAAEYKDIAAVFNFHNQVRNVTHTTSNDVVGNHVSDLENAGIDQTKLNILVEKYWNAETSLEDEETLRSYFGNNKIETKYKDIAAIFGFHSAVSQVTLEIDKLKSPPKGGEIDLNEDAKVFNLGRTLRALAAVFVLGFVAMFGYQQLTNNTKPQFVNYIEVDDPEEALKYTQDALAILSKVFNTGTNEVGNSMKVIDEMPVVGSKNAH